MLICSCSALRRSAVGVWDRAVPHPVGPPCHFPSHCTHSLCYQPSQTIDVCIGTYIYIHTHTCIYIQMYVYTHVCMYLYVYHGIWWKKREDPSTYLTSLSCQLIPSIWLWQRDKRNKHRHTNKTGHLIALPCINQPHLDAQKTHNSKFLQPQSPGYQLPVVFDVQGGTMHERSPQNPELEESFSLPPLASACERWTICPQLYSQFVTLLLGTSALPDQTVSPVTFEMSGGWH